MPIISINSLIFLKEEKKKNVLCILYLYFYIHISSVPLQDLGCSDTPFYSCLWWLAAGEVAGSLSPVNAEFLPLLIF